MNWYLKCLKQYADFAGRARRKEYWMFVLFNMIFAFALGLIDGIMGWVSLEIGLGLLGGIYSVALFIPGLAVAVRRLHDIGKSGWNFLFVLIPIIGPFILLVWFCTEGEGCQNAWGPDPKAEEV